MATAITAKRPTRVSFRDDIDGWIEYLKSQVTYIKQVMPIIPTYEINFKSDIRWDELQSYVAIVLMECGPHYTAIGPYIIHFDRPLVHYFKSDAYLYNAWQIISLRSTRNFNKSITHDIKDTRVRDETCIEITKYVIEHFIDTSDIVTYLMELLHKSFFKRDKRDSPNDSWHIRSTVLLEFLTLCSSSKDIEILNHLALTVAKLRCIRNFEEGLPDSDKEMYQALLVKYLVAIL